MDYAGHKKRLTMSKPWMDDIMDRAGGVTQVQAEAEQQEEEEEEGKTSTTVTPQKLETP